MTVSADHVSGVNNPVEFEVMISFNKEVSLSRSVWISQGHLRRVHVSGDPGPGHLINDIHGS